MDLERDVLIHNEQIRAALGYAAQMLSSTTVYAAG